MKFNASFHIKRYRLSILPEKCAGRYWIRSRNDDGKQIDVISVEALRAIKANEEDKWIIKSNRRFVIVDKDE